MKRWLIMIAALLAIIVLVAVAKGFKFKAQMDEWAAMGEPMATVSTVKASYQDWQPAITAVGTTRAVRGVDLAAEMSGVVQSVQFHSGMAAAKNDLLVQLVVDADLARLKSLEADAALTKVVAERSAKQLEAQAISQAQLDNDLARHAERGGGGERAAGDHPAQGDPRAVHMYCYHWEPSISLRALFSVLFLRLRKGG